MWQIDKRFDFCYGHRVWTQNLDDAYCAYGENTTKCKHLHGHEGNIRVFLESNELDSGFVTDFKHLGWLKDFINKYIDHKFIVDFYDPLFETIIGCTSASRGVYLIDGEREQLLELNPVFAPHSNVVRGWTIDTSEVRSGHPSIPLLNGFFIVPFVPTSENLAEWVYKIVDEKMKRLNVETSHIEWWETPKSRSVYFGNK